MARARDLLPFNGHGSIPVTSVYEDRRFEGKHDRNSGRVIEDRELRRCEFVYCSFSITRDVRKRSTARRIKATQCSATACHVWGGVLEDVLIDGLSTSDTLRVNGAAFRHVILRGRIDDLLIHPNVWPGTATPEEQRAFEAANAAYYSTVDWALDIREAEFREAEIQGIPMHLVMRDPASQFVVRRESLADDRWRRVDLSGTQWAESLQFLIDDGYREKLLIAPKRNSNYQRLLRGLQLLRDAGIADPT